MAVNPQEVVELYVEGELTMDAIAARLGITKSRVQQILKQQGVKARRYRPGSRRKPRQEKAYRAYEMTPATMLAVERLAELLGVSRTAVVTQAIEEMADRRLPGWREAAVDTVAGKRQRRPRRRRPHGE